MENKLLPDTVYQMILNHIEENRGNTNGDIVIDYQLRKELEKFFLELMKDNFNKEIIIDKSYIFYKNFLDKPEIYIKNQLPALKHIEFSVMDFNPVSNYNNKVIYIRLQLRDFNNIYPLTHNLYTHLSLEENIQSIIDNEINNIDNDINYLKEKKKLLLKLKKNKFNK